MEDVMSVWIMEPRDPLLVRDGRPFGADPGARSVSLAFPFPSTIAGGIRTRAGVNEEGIFQYGKQRVGDVFRYTDEDKAALARLRRLEVRGPLLVQLTGDAEKSVPAEWLVPAPRDALLLPPEQATPGDTLARIEQLVPVQWRQSAQTDLDQRSLWLVGQQSGTDQRKPLQHPPAYWYWKRFERWLLHPSELTGKEQQLSALGLRGLERERRMHVSIEGKTATARKGMLFETSGLEFTASAPGERRLQDAQRLALAVAVAEKGYTIRPGVDGFAGERRIVTWRKSSAQFPTYSETLVKSLCDDQHCRLFLLTPACFKEGYRPGAWFQAEAARCGVTIEFKAIAIQRPQVVSGWDLEHGRPKPSRRLAPAGTVFFLSLKGSKQAITNWIEATWMHCISDDEQDRLDGFGLAALGTWSGKVLQMGKEETA